jgi:hypothetical protein
MLYLQDLSTKLAQDRGSIGASEEGSHVDDRTHSSELLSLRWTILLLTAFLIAYINSFAFLPVTSGFCIERVTGKNRMDGLCIWGENTEPKKTRCSMMVQTFDNR